MKYAFYPGCSLESTAWDYDKSTRAICRALGIELVDIPDWVCCGSTPGHATNPYLALALPAANLVKAKEMDLPILTACASCYARLRTANHKIKNSSKDREMTEKVAGFAYDGSVPVKHIIDVLVNEIGPEKIRKMVTNSLSGIPIASYYGCLLSRPPDIVAFEDAEHPTCLDNLVEAAGGNPVDWPYKTECCGASLSLSNAEIVARLSHKIIGMANRAGAELMVLACPLCHV
ncbi:MAG: heterodisulfide reductase subunit B, partial [bacterium]|nr:heterodisulfide reductase subunit B [bacterium]